MTETHSTKSYLASAFTIALIALGSLSIFISPANAVTPSVTKISLPAGSKAISLAVDGNFLYYASNATGQLFKVNSLDNSYTTIDLGSHHWTASYKWRDAVWLIDHPSGLYAYNLTTSTLGEANNISPNVIGAAQGSMRAVESCVEDSYSGGVVVGCARYQTFLYSASGTVFDKIENLGDIPGNPKNAGYWNFPYTLSSGGGTYKGFADGGKGNVVFTDLNNGWLWFYEASSNSLSRYSGFTRPAGVDVLDGNAYVAQNVADGGIAVFSLTTRSIVSTIATPGATPFDVISTGTGIVWGSNGSDGSICPVGGICVNTGEQNYYLNRIGSKIYAGYLGSSGVAVVSGLTVPSLSVSTTTTTITSGISSSSSSTSTSSSSTTTTAATSTVTITASVTTTVGFGGIESYTPQTLPNIHLNPSERMTQNGSITLTGLLWLQLGGSVGDFAAFSAPSPSRGTFNSFGYKFPDSVEPQPACSIIPYLWFCKTVASPVNSLQASQTYYGTFCNNEYITKSAAECNGNGIPVSYQTFSVTVSNLPQGLTAVTLLATGTESNGEAFKSNIFIYNMGS